MKKRYIITTLLLLVNLQLSAQKYDLGKVTVEELNEKAHPRDTSAVASILFEKGLVKFEFSESEGNFEMVTTVKTKIKIYKKEGYELANKSIPYFIGNSSAREKVNISDAVTYNLVGGKIEKSKLKSDGEFNENINKFYARKKITMPNVREGSIIEYEYTVRSFQFGAIDEWTFQSFIPVNYSEYKTIIPEFYVYKDIQKGFIFPKVTKEMGSVSIKSSDKQRSEGLLTTTSYSNTDFNFKEEKTTYILENVPALKNESFVNNIDNYTSSIALELAMTRYPNQPYKTISTDWATVTKTIYDNDSFGLELNKTGYFEDDLKTLLAGLNSREEKLATVFNFVKSKMKWNGYYGYYCDGGVRKAYKDMTGNVAEINLMLTAMLRHAGIEANPVLVSTRANGIALFPNRSAYNYVIAAVEFENGIVLLDATNKYSLPNILPIRDLNWFGRMIRKDGTSAEVDLMPKMISKDIVNLIATVNADGSIEGKIREQYFDYSAYVFRDNYADLSKESLIEKIEKEDKGLEIIEYDFINKNELGLPIVENYSFKHTNSVEIIGDKMYFSPLLFFGFTENPFKQDTREYPIDFSFPSQDKYLMNITIPDGYVVETLPQSVSIPMSDNNGSMKYMITNKDKQIQLSVIMEINSAIISSEYYEELKGFFAEAVKKQTEKIVLKKG